VNLNQRKHVRIHAELDVLARLSILNEEQVVHLKERYPTTPWDFMALVRAFSVLGALAAVAGLVVLVREHLNWLLISESGLALSAVGLFVLGRWLRVRKCMSTTGEVAELIGSMGVQGLMAVLAIHYSVGSKNWPALMGLHTFVLAALAYAVANRLILWYACINFFFWFGAKTYYLYGLDCYWLSMTYPVRFLAAGLGTLLLSWFHARIARGRWAVFSRVYAHVGLLVINLSLWFLSVFGYYEKYGVRYSGIQGERIFFSLLWAAVAGGCLFAGARWGVRLLRGYGLTFLIINLYTFYVRFVALNTGQAWFLHLLLIGGSLLWLALHFEHKRRRDGEKN